jgi:hypothetical protein
MTATDTASHDVVLNEELRALLVEDGIGLSAFRMMHALQLAGGTATIARLSITLRRCYSEVRDDLRDARWFAVDPIPDLSTASLTPSAVELLRRADAVLTKPTHRK